MLLKVKKIKKVKSANTLEKYFGKSILSRDCGEITLSELDSCRLMVINLYSYVKNPFTPGAFFDFQKFYKHSKILQRLMDDMVDLEIEKVNEIIKKVSNDPEDITDRMNELYMWEQIKRNAQQGRRTGSGIVGLGDTFAALGYTYGDEASLEFTDKLFRYFNDALLESSVEMSKEIGPFPIFNWEKEKNNQFLLRVKEHNPALYNDVAEYGHRNISWSTVAPTGSVAILAQTTSGIEPLFMMSYMRRKKVNPTDKSVKVDFKDQNGDSWQEFEVMHSKLKVWKELNSNKELLESPYANSIASNINWKNRVKIQGIIQKYISHSISSTTNLPNEATIEDVNEIYTTAHKVGCKGITIYRDGSRTGVLVKKKDKNDTAVELKEVKEINKNDAPKRPKKLLADVHHLKIQGIEYYVTVGFLNEKPYEIFVGSNHVNDETFRVPRNVTEGKVVKHKRGEYHLYTSTDKKYVISCKGCNEVAEALTRMISVSLRHGVDVSFIVQQLEKIDGFDNYPKVLAKTLKRYIKDGTIVTGDTCGSCSSTNLIRQDGCVSCASCGWTKCS